MPHYVVPPDSETLRALHALTAGVIGVGARRDMPQLPGCSSCELETAEGVLVHLFPASRDLEFKFEVFPLQARVVREARHSERRPIEISAPVKVSPLQTYSWLEPGATQGESLGNNPIAQFTGPRSRLSANASASCSYVGAVELLGSNGASLVVATGTFPLTLHVQGIYEDEHFRRSDYEHYRAGEA